MNEMVVRALADLRARQGSGEQLPCPRCGRDTMKPDVCTNALSRHADGIYICDECGTTEALLDFMKRPLPIESWAMFRPKVSESNFRDVPGAEAIEHIREEQSDVLIDLYERWMREPQGTSFHAYRLEAFERCPGLTEIWEQPFQAKYRVADGEVLVRCRTVNGLTEFSIELLKYTK